MATDGSTDELDLAAYLDRIGVAGGSDLSPTTETLRVLHLGHSTTIPFENLDILLGRPIGLDLASLQAKLVHTSTHPNSPFVRAVLVQRQEPGRRWSLRGTEYAEEGPDGVTWSEVSGDEAVLAVLAERFGLRFPPNTRFRHGPVVMT